MSDLSNVSPAEALSPELVLSRICAAAELLRAGGDSGAASLTKLLSSLVAAGELPAGQRLPTVRNLAKALGVSPTTVGDVWQSLARAGVIETNGRRGTFVRSPAIASARFWQLYPPELGDRGVDLSEGVPDPKLLPDLTAATASLTATTTANSYLDAPVIDELLALLRQEWPFPPEELTVVDGALDALDRIISVVVRPGDRVLVEDPSFPPIYDLLDAAGAEIVGVPLDEAGLIPAALAEALSAPAAAVFCQPAQQNPTGVSMTATRAKALARIVKPTATLVIEDDHSRAANGVSLGSHLPAQTLVIRSFSKTHGPEIRLAAIGGAGEPLRQLVRRRQLGPGWSSRILQQLLVALLTDETARQTVEQARQITGERRARITTILDERGVRYTGTDGINLWVEVDDERSALVALAAQGIVVAPGTPFMLDTSPTAGQFIRVTVGAVHGGFTELGAALADAATRRGRGGA